MTDSPSGPVHTRETGLGEAPDTQITPRSKHPPRLRLEQRAPSGAGVKDLRPLTRSASGRSLTPTPQFGARKTWRNRPKERSANPRKALDRPHSFRDVLPKSCSSQALDAGSIPVTRSTIRVQLTDIAFLDIGGAEDWRVMCLPNLVRV